MASCTMTILVRSSANPKGWKRTPPSRTVYPFKRAFNFRSIDSRSGLLSKALRVRLPRSKNTRVPVSQTHRAFLLTVFSDFALVVTSLMRTHARPLLRATPLVSTLSKPPLFRSGGFSGVCVKAGYFFRVAYLALTPVSLSPHEPRSEAERRPSGMSYTRPLL